MNIQTPYQTIYKACCKSNPSKFKEDVQPTLEDVIKALRERQRDSNFVDMFNYEMQLIGRPLTPVAWEMGTPIKDQPEAVLTRLAQVLSLRRSSI